jgi:adenylyltransferase/sulfurtransferase
MSIIQDFFRYNRQVMLPEVGEAGQAKKKKSQVLLIAGGCSILQYLATAGVGTIGIVDDTIEIHNHRQILYTEDQVGLSKAETAKAALH